MHWTAPDIAEPRAATLTRTHERGTFWGSDAPALATLLDRTLTRASADQVGAILLAANIESVNFRYDEDDLEPIYQYHRAQAAPVEVLKAIDSYEYQACEPDSWPHSEARTIYEALRSTTIAHLPGYDDALWAP